MRLRLPQHGSLRGSDHSLSLAFGLALVAGFCLAKVVAIKLGPAGVGYQSAITSTAVISAGLAMAGVSSAVPLIAGSRPEASPRQLRRVVTRILLCTMPLSLLAGAWIAVRQLNQFDPEVLITGMVMASLGWVLTNTRLSLLSTFAGSTVTARHIMVAGVASASITAAVVLLGPSSALPLAVGVGALAGPLLAVSTVRWSIDSRDSTDIRESAGDSAVTAREVLAAGIHPFLGSLSALLALTALPIIVLSISSPETSGLFRAGYSLGTAIPTIAIATITNSFYPRFAVAFETEEESRAISQRSLRSTTSLVLPALIAISVLAPILLRVAFSPEFVVASGALVLICVASTVQVLANFAWFALFSAGKSRQCIVIQACAMLFLSAAVAAGAVTDNVSLVAVGYLLGWLLFLILIIRLANSELQDRNPLAMMTGRLSAAWITVILFALATAAAWSLWLG